MKQKVAQSKFTPTRIQRGFSLLESLIVLAFTGVILAISIPQASDISRRLNLKSEASSIRLFLERCLSFSLSSRRTVQVAVNQSDLLASTEDGTPLFSYKLKQGVTFTGNLTAREPLFFYQMISASPKTLTINKGSLSCSIVISLRGRIRFTC
jgi:prepilin-type N-terminal cleavage/methylation domain-containing protein